MTISRGNDTFVLTNGSTLDLMASATANDTVSVPNTGGVNATFNLVDRGGHVAINLFSWGSSVTGNMVVNNGGSVEMNGGSHNNWIPTGVNRVAGGAHVTLAAPIIQSGGGTFRVSDGARLEFLSMARPLSETVLDGGSVNYGLNIGGTVTFASAAGSEFDIHTDPPVASYTMDANDLLTLFDGNGTGLGAVTVHDRTAQAIQVDKTSFGVSIVADNTPHPGMIVGTV